MGPKNVVAASLVGGLEPISFVLYRLYSQQDLFPTERYTAIFMTLLLVICTAATSIGSSTEAGQIFVSLFGCGLTLFISLVQYRRVVPHLMYPLTIHVFATGVLSLGTILTLPVLFHLGNHQLDGEKYGFCILLGFVLYVSIYFLFVAIRYLCISVILFSCVLLVPLAQVLSVSIENASSGAFKSDYLVEAPWQTLMPIVLLGILAACYLALQTAKDRGRVEVEVLWTYKKKPRRLQPPPRLTCAAVEENARLLYVADSPVERSLSGGTIVPRGALISPHRGHHIKI